MRTVSQDLMNDILAGKIVNCLKLSMSDGTEYGYTDYKDEITVDGFTYEPAPGLEKVKMSLTANAEVSNQELAAGWGLEVDESDLRSGKFDNATLEVAWASWAHPSYGKLVVFTGQLGEVTWTEEGFKADIVSYMKNLSKNIGAIFTANCRHTLFSTVGVGSVGACGLSAGSFTTTGSVQSVATNKWKFTLSGSQTDGYFTNGNIKFTSGYNAGLSAIVKVHTGNEVTLLLPTAFTIAPGDTYEIQAGCDKTFAACQAFNNVANFGGFPHIQTDASL